MKKDVGFGIDAVGDDEKQGMPKPTIRVIKLHRRAGREGERCSQNSGQLW